MKVFVSGQIAMKESVRRAYAELESRGYEITHDWTTTDDLADKRADNVESGIRAAKDIAGVLASDVYILLTDNDHVGKGMYVELGAALARRALTGTSSIYTVGPLNHLSIFYLHPDVEHFETISDLLEHLSSTLSARAERLATV